MNEGQVRWRNSCPFCKRAHYVNYYHELNKVIQCECGARYEKNFWWGTGRTRFLGFWTQEKVV